ncbi:MAG: hypothetical protein ABIK28_07335 [Planctomycetota bacterium]
MRWSYPTIATRSETFLIDLGNSQGKVKWNVTPSPRSKKTILMESATEEERRRHYTIVE